MPETYDCFISYARSGTPAQVQAWRSVKVVVRSSRHSAIRNRMPWRSLAHCNVVWLQLAGGGFAYRTAPAFGRLVPMAVRRLVDARYRLSREAEPEAKPLRLFHEARKRASCSE